MNNPALLEQRTLQCETIEDVLALLEECSGQYLSWQAFFSDLLDGTGLSYTRFAAVCSISKNTVKSWCTQGGVPKSRDTFLKIGFGASMDPEAVSSMLSRFGGYCGLNPRDPFDAVCIFCLRRRCCGDDRFDFHAAEALYQRLLPEQAPLGPASTTTTKLMERLLTIDTEAEFQSFFRLYGPDLCSRKLKLERYLEEFLTIRRLEAGRGASRPATLHSLQLPVAMEKQLSQLKRRGTVPRRRSLIAMGLHLGMTLEELDLLLQYAGMDRLWVRDRLESVLIYALQQLALTHPELALGNATALLAITRNAETRRRCTALAQEYWQASYRSEDEDVESVAHYVRHVLEQLELEEAEELLPLLQPRPVPPGSCGSPCSPPD